jgi:hypothetical protein
MRLVASLQHLEHGIPRIQAMSHSVLRLAITTFVSAFTQPRRQIRLSVCRARELMAGLMAKSVPALAEQLVAIDATALPTE